MAKQLAFFFLLGMCSTVALQAQLFKNSSTKETMNVASDTSVSNFLILLSSKDDKLRTEVLKAIDKNWQESDEIMMLETIYFTQQEVFSENLVRLLQKKTRKDFGYDYDQWFPYIWNKNPSYTDEYFSFKAKLHRSIDPRFYRYFDKREKQSLIRLDEVRWGGVLQDGIPPLRNPKMIDADKATYLDGSDVVFGIEVNGDARAYPKRILAWHEMFVDTVGGVNVAGVYCTLCGTVILYKTEHDGVNHEIGTSGFLYRSNKLMYDKATQSLWSTLDGSPVIGPLVGKGIQLDYLSVVTTTWDEWKKRHPQTSVLSLDTGHRRNYDEGAAYRSYFATDELMFTIPTIDKSLNNKDEVLVIRMPKEIDENMAIASDYLKENIVYPSKIGEVPFTVFTDKSGAHRVYKTEGIVFTDYDGGTIIRSDSGERWDLTETAITSQSGRVLSRFESHSAFWFGYKAAYPDVKLIK